MESGQRMSSGQQNIFFTEHRSSAVCLICQETVAAFIEYNISRHFTTKHASYASKLLAEEREATAQVGGQFTSSTKFFTPPNCHAGVILRIATTKLTPDFDTPAKKGDQQHCSH